MPKDKETVREKSFLRLLREIGKGFTGEEPRKKKFMAEQPVTRSGKVIEQ